LTLCLTTISQHGVEIVVAKAAKFILLLDWNLKEENLPYETAGSLKQN
jgi:hypothetical protein